MKKPLLAGAVLAGTVLAGTVLAGTLAVTPAQAASTTASGGGTVTAPLALVDHGATDPASSYLGIAGVDSLFGGSNTSLAAAQAAGVRTTLPGIGHSGPISQGGNCLTATASHANPASVACDGSPRQIWTVHDDGRIEDSSGRFLTVEKVAAGAATGVPGATLNRLVLSDTTTFTLPSQYRHDDGFTAGLTRDAEGRVVATGTGSAGALVRVDSVAGVGGGRATVDADGTWSVTLPSSVAAFPVDVTETADGVQVAHVESTL